MTELVRRSGVVQEAGVAVKNARFAVVRMTAPRRHR